MKRTGPLMIFFRFVVGMTLVIFFWWLVGTRLTIPAWQVAVLPAALLGFVTAYGETRWSILLVVCLVAGAFTSEIVGEWFHVYGRLVAARDHSISTHVEESLLAAIAKQHAQREAAKPADTNQADREAAQPADTNQADREAAQPADTNQADREAAQPADTNQADRKAAKPTDTNQADRKAAKPTDTNQADRKAAKPSDPNQEVLEAAKPAEEKSEDVKPADAKKEQQAEEPKVIIRHPPVDFMTARHMAYERAKAEWIQHLVSLVLSLLIAGQAARMTIQSRAKQV